MFTYFVYLCLKLVLPIFVKVCKRGWAYLRYRSDTVLNKLHRQHFERFNLKLDNDVDSHKF